MSSDIPDVFNGCSVADNLRRLSVNDVLKVITEIQKNWGGLSIPFLWHQLRVKLGLEEPGVKEEPSLHLHVRRAKDTDDINSAFADYISTASVKDLEVLKPFFEEDLRQSCYEGFSE